MTVNVSSPTTQELITDEELLSFFRRLNHPHAVRYRHAHKAFLESHYQQVATYVEEVSHGNIALADHYWLLLSRYGGRTFRGVHGAGGNRIGTTPLSGTRITSFSLVLNGRSYLAAGCFITVLVAIVVGAIGRVAIFKAQAIIEARLEQLHHISNP